MRSPVLTLLGTCVSCNGAPAGTNISRPFQLSLGRRRACGSLHAPGTSILMHIVEHTTGCADDASYHDNWGCDQWRGYPCRAGYPPVEGTQRIAQLVFSCPVACSGSCAPLPRPALCLCQTSMQPVPELRPRPRLLAPIRHSTSLPNLAAAPTNLSGVRARPL